MPPKGKDQSCPICFTRETKNSPKHIRLHCESSCCQECLVEWFVTKIRENHRNSADIHVPCLFSGCKGTLQVQQTSSQFSIEHQKRINEELLQAYLNNQEDVRRCPRKNCLYAGIIASKPCGKDFQCGLCSTTWTDKSQKNLHCLKNFFSVKNEVLSQLWKFLFSKKCPQCKSKIIKNGGCDHIICLKCDTGFCWRCPSRYPAHNIIIHHCYPVFTGIIFLIISFFIIALIAYFTPSLRWILDWAVIPAWTWLVPWISWLIDWIYWSFWLFRDFLVLNLMALGFDNAIRPKRPDWRICVGCLLLGCSMCFLIYYFEIFWPVVKFACWEYGLCLGVIVVDKLVNWNKNQVREEIMRREKSIR